jgi:carbon-monoxide dehydrogenase large subunit
VFTAEDLLDTYNPMPCGIEEYEEWALAHEKVRFAGEPVAAIVSTDRYVAEDLTELVDVEYEPLPAVIDPRESITDEVLLHDDVGTNIADGECLEFGPVDESLKQADNVVTGEFSCGRASGNPIETSGVLAEYDPDSDTFDIFSNLQVHTLVADQVYEPLGYDKKDVRLRTPDHIGGSYGTKSSIHRYCCLAAMASQFLDGRPIKFTEGRKEYLEGAMSTPVSANTRSNWVSTTTGRSERSTSGSSRTSARSRDIQPSSRC